MRVNAVPPPDTGPEIEAFYTAVMRGVIKMKIQEEI